MIGARLKNTAFEVNAVSLCSVELDFSNVKNTAFHDVDGCVAVDDASQHLSQVVFVVSLVLGGIFVVDNRSLIRTGNIDNVVSKKTCDIAFGITDFGSIKHTAHDIQSRIFKETFIGLEVSGCLVVNGILGIQLGNIEIAFVEIDGAAGRSNLLECGVAICRELTVFADLSQSDTRCVAGFIDKFTACEVELIRRGCRSGFIHKLITITHGDIGSINRA